MRSGPTRIRWDVAERARLSGGLSNGAIYEMVLRALRRRAISGGILLDVGCGLGKLAQVTPSGFHRYIGADIVRYEEFPAELEFAQIEPDTGRVPLADEAADVVAALETIEHVENPRAFMREICRLAKPGGWLVVTTPNQLSALNLVSLALKGRHVQFQDVHYPAHLTALLEVDLVRMAREQGLTEVGIEFSERGRIPLTPVHYPRGLSHLLPRSLSDNVLLIGHKPAQSGRDGTESTIPA